jgi:hypothetical protein
MVGFTDFGEAAEPYERAERMAENREAEIEVAASWIMRQLKTPEGVDKRSWSYEPPELSQAIALLAQGCGIKAMKMLEQMAQRLAEEKFI